MRIINDAAMQALGSYKGGRMLFLGLGTGLGSAMIVDGVLEPMELAHLLYKNGKTYEDYLGLRGLERLGKKRWRKHVAKVTKMLKALPWRRLRRAWAAATPKNSKSCLPAPNSAAMTTRFSAAFACGVKARRARHRRHRIRQPQGGRLSAGPRTLRSSTEQEGYAEQSGRISSPFRLLLPS